MISRTTVALVAAVAAVVSGGSQARAGDIIGVLDVKVDGVSAEAAAKFERRIEDGLGNAGFEVATRARLGELLGGTDYVDGCIAGPCLSEVYRNTEVRLVLVAEITGVGRSYSFVVTLLDTRTGQPTSQVADRCAVCTVDEAMATATLAVISLVTGLGQATVVDPAGPTGTEETGDAPDERLVTMQQRVDGNRRLTRRSALFLMGAAAIAGGIGVTYLARDDDSVGYGALGAGGAFAVASGAMFVISGTF